MKIVYLQKYGPTPIISTNAKEYYQNKDILITGDSGGLGLSTKIAFEYLNIVPSRLRILVRENTNIDAWAQFASKNDIPLDVSCHLSDLSLNLESGIILHLAGYAQPKKFMAQPQELIYLNTNFIERLMQIHESNHVIFSSTTEVYSGHTSSVNELSEVISPPNHPRSIYIYSKLLGEAILSTYPIASHHTFRIALASPHMWNNADQRVLAELISKGVKTGKVSLLGGWDSIRSYQYGPIAMMRVLCAAVKAPSGIYNCGGGELLTLEMMAKKISQKIGVEYDASRREKLDIAAPPHVIIDNSKIEKYIGMWPEERFSELLDVYMNG